MTKVNFNRARFIAASDNYKQLPASNLAEVAFWGRSNVGKSSLICSLTDNSKLVRTSKKPGCTKTINLFNIDEKLILADLPGYGFANVSKASVLAWQQMIVNYMVHRANLRTVFLLIDARRSIMEIDWNMISLINEIERRFAVLLTKEDGIKDSAELQQSIANVMRKSQNRRIEVLATSSKNSTNIDRLRSIIANLV